MRRSLGMNIFCQKNNISACKMWFIEYKCTNCSRNCKYKCTLHPNIMADPRITYSSCNSCFFDNTHFFNVCSMWYTLCCWLWLRSNNYEWTVFGNGAKVATRNEHNSPINGQNQATGWQGKIVVFVPDFHLMDVVGIFNPNQEGGGQIGPPVSFSLFNPLKKIISSWNFLTFPE